MFRFSCLRLDLHKVFEENSGEVIGQKITGSSDYLTGLEDYHEVRVILSTEEIEKIVAICDEAAARTAGAIAAAAKQDLKNY